ncbi:unnamed protein product [Adineta steineri]|uniref:Uncharacterized protein n=1 Tax=Adineta steineri TaxID=433720 RepID=A0A818ZBR7_9BILA|nr:unnamed protein product [Adineta steineri]CAF0870339.1 unnamed protein product [Adineta steineri]CAF0870697.1 unnamed protein product [Adineta steineri]CAF3767335.1 unnamed protein product [Adineta steineri]CAF3853248.1 unnamed protein product [Adineta steineri]
MPDLGKISLIAAAAISAFSLLLLIISVATPVWLDDGTGNTVGLFRQCTSGGCINANQVTQGGLSIFGLLLLVFAIVANIAGIFMRGKPIILWIALALLYFSSMFVMSAYATWGVYSRDPTLYGFATFPGHSSMGYSYNLCVAAHYFIWTALTLLALGIGYSLNQERN